jgi:hypothetical protein
MKCPQVTSPVTLVKKGHGQLEQIDLISFEDVLLTGRLIHKHRL